jgi:hypothetical protein
MYLSAFCLYANRNRQACCGPSLLPKRRGLCSARVCACVMCVFMRLCVCVCVCCECICGVRCVHTKLLGSLFRYECTVGDLTICLHVSYLAFLVKSIWFVILSFVIKKQRWSAAGSQRVFRAASARCCGRCLAFLFGIITVITLLRSHKCCYFCYFACCFIEVVNNSGLYGCGQVIPAAACLHVPRQSVCMCVSSMLNKP